MIVRGVHPPAAPRALPTIDEQLRATVATHGARVALREEERAVTWSELDALADRMARALLAHGVEPGDRVAVWMPNSIDWVVTWLAAVRVRAVFVPVSTRLTVTEFRHVVSDCDPRVLLVNVAPFDIDPVRYLRALTPSGPLTVVVRDGSPSLDSFLELADRTDAETLAARSARIGVADPVLIIYTSGSTGGAKGVVHDHRVLRNEAAIAWYLGITSASRILGHMPFFHVAGGMSAVLPAIITGAEVVLMPTWSVEEAVALIRDRRVSVFGGIATHYVDLLGHVAPEDRSLASLRSGWIGGALNPSEVMREAAARLGFRPLPAYGMTETTSVTTYPLPEDPDEVVYGGRGRPISDFEVAVGSLETGRPLPAGEQGEILVRGHLVMREYHGRPAETARAIDADGWFHTGDVGRLDEQGYLSITGRSKEMYVVGGNNVFPAEVETVLTAHPDVVQVHVVAVPDERLGEVGYAYVQTRDIPVETADLSAFAAERLSGYKVPAHLELVSRWPLNGTGKVDKLELRARAIATLGLEDVAARRLLPSESGVDGIRA
ncbi:class I adenylate-forming enzyme family protein [Actinophytocola sp.]|uniref:class I adenylate-forming enzyme family protein n=1 Tax=Actinophytocola sp. TaxID=1872138 RepID=UPI003D6A73E9